MAKQIIFDIVVKGSKDVLELQNKIAQLKKELKGTSDKNIASGIHEQIAKLGLELDKAKIAAKQAKIEFAAQDDSIGAYKQLSAQLIVARERYKQLASQAVLGANIQKKEIAAAAAEAKRLDNALKQIDASTGVFGRSVGNYAGSLKGLFQDLKKTILTSGLIGRGGIGAFATQLTSAVNFALDAFDKLNDALSASAVISKKVKAETDDAAKSYAKSRVALDTLTVAVQDSNLPLNEREQALQALQEQFPGYFQNINAETATYSDLNAEYEKANANLIENLKRKTIAKVLEDQLVESIQKNIEAERERQKTDALRQVQGLTALTLVSEVSTKFSEVAAETSKSAANDIDTVTKQVNEVIDAIGKNIGAYTASFGDLNELTSGVVREQAKANAKAQAEAESLLQKNRERIEEERKKFKEGEKEFNDKIISDLESFLDQQQQAAIESISNQFAKQAAIQTAAYEKQKRDDKSRFDQIIAYIEEQQAKIIELFGEGSAELLAFQKQTNEQVVQLQATYAILTEQNEANHQAELTRIEKAAQSERLRNEEEAQQASIQQAERAQDETRNAFELQSLILKEQLDQRKISIESYEAQVLQLTKDRIGEEKQLLDDRIANGVFADEQERQSLVLARQRLNNELSALDADYTKQVEQQRNERVKIRIEEAEQTFNAFSEINGQLQGLVDAFNQAEQDRLQAQIDYRQANLDKLGEQIEDATGNEKKFLEQRAKQEEENIAAIEKKQKEARKNAAIANKAFALTQAGINAALSVTNLLATLIDPTPVQAFKIAALAFTTALNIASIAQIAAAPLKYARGGFTGSGSGSPDETGFKVAGLVHEDEWVAPKKMVYHPRYAPTINWLESERKGFAIGGFTSAPPPLPSTVLTPATNSVALDSVISSMDAKTDAINKRIDRFEVVLTTNTLREIDQDEQDRKEIKTLSSL